MSRYDVVGEDIDGAFEVSDGASDLADTVEQKTGNLAHLVAALIFGNHRRA